MAAVRSARLRWCDLQGTQTRCEGGRIDRKERGCASLAVGATIGTLEGLHQICTLARSTFAVCQDDLRHVGVRGRGRCHWQIRQCYVEAESNALREGVVRLLDSQSSVVAIRDPPSQLMHLRCAGMSQRIAVSGQWLLEAGQCRFDTTWQPRLEEWR